MQPQPLVAFSIRLASNEASFQTKPYKLHRLETGPSANVSVTRDDALDFYRKMMVRSPVDSRFAPYDYDLKLPIFKLGGEGL